MSDAFYNNPVQVYNNPSSAVPNANTNQQTRAVSNFQKPWSIRVYQANAQSLTEATLTQVLFDTISFNTYQATGSNMYALSFATPNGSYPYSEIVVPLSGIYEAKFSVGVNAGGDATTQNAALIYVNSNQMTVGNYQPFTYSGGVPTCHEASDQLQLNKGDTVQFYVVITGSSTFTSEALPEWTWALLRYLGAG